MAADVFWNGSVSNDWNTASNWTPGLPTAPDDAIVNNAGAFPTAVISADLTVNPRDIIVGRGAGNTGQLDLTAGNITTAGWTFIGRNTGSAGTFNMNAPGGSYSTGRFIVGEDGDGTFNLDAGIVNSTGEMWIGQGGTGTGEMNMTGGTVNSSNWTVVARAGSTGSLNMSGGTINKTGGGEYINGDNGVATVDQSGGVINSNNQFWVGQGGGATNTVYNLSGPATTEINSGGTMVVAQSGAGNVVMNQSGGKVTIATGELQVGQNGGSNGTYNLSGGSVTANNWVAVGRDSGTGKMNISGGTLTKNGGGHVTIGTLGTNSNGFIDVNSTGAVIANTGNVYVGEGGTTSTGRLDISGNGLVDISNGQLIVAVGNSTTGTANLVGGTLRTQRIGSGTFSDGRPAVDDPNNSGSVGNVSTINFTGTQVVATAATADFISQIDTANLVVGGGLKIDSNGNNIGSSQVFTGLGGIAKSGAGTFTLSGSSGYTGKTTVQTGTLALAATGAISASTTIEVQAGAILDVSAVSGWTLATGQTMVGNGSVNGTATIAAGAILAPGSSVGELTFNNDLTLAGTAVMEVADGTSDVITVVGALTYGGILDLSNIGGPLEGYGWAPTTFDLFDFASESGTFTAISLPSLNIGFTWTPFDYGNGSISIVPEPSSLLLGALGSLVLIRRRRR